jgi:hypothetical protein
MEIKTISPNSEVVIKFSERLRPIADYNLNMSSDKPLNFLLDLSYFSFLQDSNPSAPEVTLVSWDLLNFTAEEILIKLNFSDPLYVSTGAKKDMLGARVNDSNYF